MNMKGTRERQLRKITGQPWFRPASIALTGVVFFTAVVLSIGGLIRGTSLGVAAMTVSVGVVRWRTLRERVTLPLLTLFLLVLMGFASTQYADAGGYALEEYLKLFVAFCLALDLLALAPREASERWIASVLACYAAVSSFISIDLISTRWFSGIYGHLLAALGIDTAGLVGVEAGVRLISFFANPNVFAGLAGLGVLLSLGLALTGPRAAARAAGCASLYICSLGFVLAFSMGASGTIALAFLVFLALTAKERRADALVLMLETALLAVPAAAAVASTSFGAWDGFNAIPLLCLVLGAAALAALDCFAGQKLSAALAARNRLIPIAAGAVVAGLAVYAALAWNLTGPASLAAGGSLRRAAYPDAGTYTLTVTAGAPVTVRVESQNRVETMMHTETVLYNGPAGGAEFVVPEDSLVVYFNFYTPEGAEISDVSYADADSSRKLPLRYWLLPGFIANRLQGLFANENAVQRLVFFEDGLKVWRKSPVIGMGIGAFTSQQESVQSFAYFTRYVHNHYIQSLVDMGVIGLVLFAALLAVTGYAIWKSRRIPLAPALAACLVFMAVHAAVEVVFSHYYYLPLAYGVIALAGLACGKELSRTVRTASIAAFAALILAFSMMVANNVRAEKLVEREHTSDSLIRAAEMDRFGWYTYKLSFVQAVMNAEEVDEDGRALADRYAKELERYDDSIGPFYLADYYFKSGRGDEAFMMLRKFVLFCASNPAAWREALGMACYYYPAADDPGRHLELTRGIVDLMEEWDAEHIGSIELPEETVERLEAIGISV